MSSKLAYKLNLTQCLAIQANQYRSVHNDYDYYPELIDSRIYELQSSLGDRLLKSLEIKMQREQNAYNAFLDLVGVPPFHFTWDSELNEYIPF